MEVKKSVLGKVENRGDISNDDSDYFLMNKPKL